ncbi:beta-lactamase hydrolase domain-containing protein [Plastorhodobacter daqingensis]|uniref:Beta-lactamase hydrolase domain-containing protein n=1 Tax=Plastorhodobacter daqingensis TaxID=1387281 RepID=A0ABW2UDP5_9RHOB
MPKTPLRKRFSAATRLFRETWGTDISSARARRRAWWDFQLMDHAFLRRWWSNSAEIAPGVWRSNQPSPQRIARYARAGIRSVLNLRGPGRHSHYLFEKEACEAAGITLVDRRLYAAELPSRDELLALFQAFDAIEKPFVMHCKSGADRSGFGAALYLIDTGTPVSEARRQLHWKHLHFKRDATGILDFFLESYAAAQAQSGTSLRDWIARDYDPEALTRAYRAGRTAR